MEINIHAGFSGSPMKRVVCPDCGAGGGNRSPCWCHKCHEVGVKVMMLPACNDRLTCNWSELVKGVL